MMKFAFSFKTSKNQSTVSSPQSAINNLQSAVNKEENNYQTILKHNHLILFPINRD